MRPVFGKYRGNVEDNADPQGLGRLRVSVPAVLGEGRAAWAMPCLPYAGPGVGLLLLPPVGAAVWVEFEGGDPELPIWTGCFWRSGEAPVDPVAPATRALVTDGLRLVLQDESGGGLRLELGDPAVSAPLGLSMDGDGILLENGAMKLLLSSSSVSVNDGALEVI